jgi:excisionase family DNA binding protein
MFYSVEHAAQRLALHPKTVLRFIRDGRLRATRIGKSWRIVESDLDAFAGVRVTPLATAEEPRVTAVADLPAIPKETAHRLASALQAIAISRPPGPTSLQLETAYDPERSHLKVVAIGGIADVATLLQSLHTFAVAFR